MYVLEHTFSRRGRPELSGQAPFLCGEVWWHAGKAEHCEQNVEYPVQLRLEVVYMFHYMFQTPAALSIILYSIRAAVSWPSTCARACSFCVRSARACDVFFRRVKHIHKRPTPPPLSLTLPPRFLPSPNSVVVWYFCPRQR